MGPGDPHVSFPDQPGGRRSPTLWGQLPNHGPLTIENCCGSLSRPQGLLAGGCSVHQPPPEPPAHGEGGMRGRKQTLLLVPGHRGTCQAPVLWQRVSGGHGPCPLRVLASQEAFPEGHCISMVTVLGVPPPASPSSAPSRRARWKTTLSGSHSR